jgi:tRNA pseudouridine38-40 synthase
MGERGSRNAPLALPPLPGVPPVKVKIVLAYDGSGFHGFAVNHGIPTVAGTLTEAISTVVRTPVMLTGAGRTDAGVHAWGQVVSVDLPDETALADLARRLNKLCAPQIAVRSIEPITDDFDARFSAHWRRYRYDIWNAPYPNPLLEGRAWHVANRLDVEAMRAATTALLGEHDFASFCRRRPKVATGGPAPTLVRRILEVSWFDATPAFSGAACTDSVHGALQNGSGGRLLRFEIRANAFCHQMVRSIVGTLVDVGAGKLAASDIPAILAAGDRRAAGQVAPPHGLTLWEVGY